jgi:cell division transport system permease protein
LGLYRILEVLILLERSGYFVRRALRNMRQNPVLCSAAVGTVAVALTILAFFAIIVLNVQKLTRHWSEDVQVVAFIDSLPEERQLQQWMADIRSLPEVEKVDFVSRAEALKRFKKRLADDADLLEGVDPDILPASLAITLRAPSRNQAGVFSVVSRLRQNSGLSDLRYGQEWLERFESFVALLRLAGAILGGFLLFAALFIVANTIRLTLYARRDELEIMALVGATPFFIKSPFLLEGALQGALGGAFAVAGAYALFQLFLQQGLSSLLLASGVDRVTFLPWSWQLLLVAAGLLLGLVGSLLSLRKLVRI